MMPYADDLDAVLPCVTNREPFDAVIDMHDQPSREHGTRGRNTLQRARDICGTCGVQARCLREFGDAEGIIAGLTLAERVSLGIGRAS